MPGLERLRSEVLPHDSLLVVEGDHNSRGEGFAVPELAEAVDDADNFQGGELISARTLWQGDQRRRTGPE